MAITGLPVTTGNDVVTVTPTGTHSVNADTGTDTLVLNYTSLGSDIRYQDLGGGWYRYTDDVASSIDFYNFEVFNLQGGSGEDVLAGREQADTLKGGNGSDLIISGLGADVIDGGSGADRLSADYSAVGVAVSLTLAATGATTITATGATVARIEALSMTTGAGNDSIDTSAFIGNDTVNTGNGNDTVALGHGTDQSNAGDGTDTLVMDWSSITDPNAGIVSTDLGGGWRRYSAVGGDRLDYYGFERFRISGGAGADTIGGGSLADQLTGNQGNDYIDSGAGNDTVDGGDGLDTWRLDASARAGTSVVNLETSTSNFATLSGIEQIQYSGGNSADKVTALAGVYNDSFSTGQGSDTVTTGRGRDWANAGDGAGTDQLVMDWSSIDDVRHGITNTDLGGGWRRYTSASGDNLDYYGFETYVITGGAGNDLLVGGASFDTLVGNAGDDTLMSGVGIGTITGGEGLDRWNADLSTLAAARFDAQAGQTAAQMGGIGLAVTGIEALDLTTGNGADKISTAGFALNDNISTSAGNDVIDTGLGIDWLNAGADTDTLVADYSSATTAVRQTDLGGGWTRLNMADGSSRVDYYSVERFTLTGGTGNDTLGGGSLGDTLNGGAGDDVLNSGKGKDVVNGGAGTDSWSGDYSDLGINVAMTLSATGAATISGPGTKLTSIENVSISTGAGADTINLAEGTGNDGVSTGDGNDVVNLGKGQWEWANGAGGDDSLTVSFASATTGVRMFDLGGGWTRAESLGVDYRLDFFGFETLTITGSQRNDRMYGFGGEDNLSGAAGVDFINGGRGNDVLTGGVGSDVFVFNDLWNAGVDRITDGAAGDRMRFDIGLSGNMGTGDGSTLLTGQMDLQASGGVTTIHLGLDGVAGADFSVQLNGTYSAGDFSLAGTDLLFV